MAVISWRNLVDDATISSVQTPQSPLAGTELISIEKIKTRQVGDVMRWRFTGDTTFGINMNFGEAKTMNLVGILNHNLAGYDYQLRWGTTLGGNDVGSESGTFWSSSSGDAKNEFLYFADGYTAQYFRWSVTIPSFPPGSPVTPIDVDVGRIWCDNAWVPSGGISMDFGLGVHDTSVVSRANDGSTWASARQILRTMNVNAIGTTTADFIGTASDFDSLLTMDLMAGTHEEVVCLPLSDTQHNRNRLGIYGTIADSGPIQVRDKGANGFLTSKRFTIKEDRA